MTNRTLRLSVMYVLGHMAKARVQETIKFANSETLPVNSGGVGGRGSRRASGKAGVVIGNYSRTFGFIQRSRNLGVLGEVREGYPVGSISQGGH